MFSPCLTVIEVQATLTDLIKVQVHDVCYSEILLEYVLYIKINQLDDALLIEWHFKI